MGRRQRKYSCKQCDLCICNAYIFLAIWQRGSLFLISATIRAGSKRSSNAQTQPGLLDLDRLPSWVDLDCLVTWLGIKNSKGLWFTWRNKPNIRLNIFDFGVNCKITILCPFLIKILGSSVVCVSSGYVGAKATLLRMKSAKEEKENTSHRHIWILLKNINTVKVCQI